MLPRNRYVLISYTPLHIYACVRDGKFTGRFAGLIIPPGKMYALLLRENRRERGIERCLSPSDRATRFVSSRVETRQQEQQPENSQPARIFASVCKDRSQIHPTGEDCLTFGRVWRGSSTLGELIVASPARRRQRPGHPRLSHLSSSYLLPRATPAAGFGVGRAGNASTTTSDDGLRAIARLLPAGTAFPHGPFCNRERERDRYRARSSARRSVQRESSRAQG